jgi:hypothetical protein
MPLLGARGALIACGGTVPRQPRSPPPPQWAVLDRIRRRRCNQCSSVPRRAYSRERRPIPNGRDVAHEERTFCDGQLIYLLQLRLLLNLSCARLAPGVLSNDLRRLRARPNRGETMLSSHRLNTSRPTHRLFFSSAQKRCTAPTQRKGKLCSRAAGMAAWAVIGPVLDETRRPKSCMPSE